MSPEAIDRRSRETGELYEFDKEIAASRWLGTVAELEKATPESDNASGSRPGEEHASAS